MSAPVNTPAQVKKKTGAARTIVLVVVLAVFGGIGYLIWQNWSTEAAGTKAGECVSITGAKFSPKFEKVACDAPTVTHTVAKSLGTSAESCADPYAEFTETLDGEPVSKLCLIPNMVEGMCFEGKIVSMDSSVEKTDCSAERAVKVVKVLKDKADAAACPAGSKGTTYPEPPTTHCLAAAKPVQ